MAAMIKSLWMALACVLSFAVIGPATAQTTPDRAAERGYVLGPSDAITVVVYGQPEFNVQTRVKPNGEITVPLVGDIRAAGTTVVTLAAQLSKALVAGNYLRNPIVNVEITDFASKYVRMAGYVTTPGLVPLDRPYTALDALLRAGGAREGGANHVLLRRGGREQRLEIEALSRGGTGDPVLEPGDTLYVPRAELYYLYGQVNRPGAFPLQPGMTLRQAIAIAGGVTALGTDKRITLHRGGTREADGKLEEAIREGDVFFVRERLF